MIIPAAPPRYAVTLRRYVDGDLRAKPDRLQAAIQIAQNYHDDWQPMVDAAAAARHNQTLTVPVGRMVLNWARTQPQWMDWLEQFEWDLMEDYQREAKVIDIAEREQNKELRRRKEEKERRVAIRTPARFNRDFIVAHQNGKVIHTILHGSEWNFLEWKNRRFVSWKNDYVWYGPDEQRSIELRVSVICRPHGFINPYLVTRDEALSAGKTDCRSCARILAEREEQGDGHSSGK